MHFGKPQNDTVGLHGTVGLPMSALGADPPQAEDKACPVVPKALPDCKCVEFPNGLN